MSEAEDNVLGGVFVEMRQESEHDAQPGAVGVEEDADAVDLFDVRDVVEDAVNVFLVLLLIVSISSDAGGVDDVDKLLPKDKGVGGWSCGLYTFEMMLLLKMIKMQADLL